MATDYEIKVYTKNERVLDEEYTIIYVNSKYFSKEEGVLAFKTSEYDKMDNKTKQELLDKVEKEIEAKISRVNGFIFWTLRVLFASWLGWMIGTYII
jgi:hypothetical protein